MDFNIPNNTPNTAPQIQPQVQAPPEAPKFKKSKWFTALLIILFLLIIYGVYSLIGAIFVARAVSRDAKRGVDISSFQSGLELYFDEHQTYPDSLNELTKPIKGETFFTTIPTAPKPADGPCTDEQNEYKYTKIRADDYEITYCIGRGGKSTNSFGGFGTINVGVQKVKPTTVGRMPSGLAPQEESPSTEFKFVSPKGGEQWQVGSTQTISWTGGGKYYATVLTFHYTLTAGPYAGQPGEEVIATVKNQPNKNYDTFAWSIEPQALNFWKGPFTISACLVDQMPGDAYSGCRSEKIVSKIFDIEPRAQTGTQREQGLVYTNSQLGFQLTLTEAWAGYEVFTDNSTTVRFDLPKYKIQSPETYGVSVNFYPLSIGIVSKKEYDSKYAEVIAAGLASFLGESNGKVFFYKDHATSNMTSQYYPKGVDGRSINFEVPKVISTFKFTQ